MRISQAGGMIYFRWLVTKFPPCEHLCDLVAYFYRHAFTIIRDRGTMGLIATNTIAQGDTREGGLTTILRQGGVIYSASQRTKWPGMAAVIVSIVQISKGHLEK